MKTKEFVFFLKKRKLEKVPFPGNFVKQPELLSRYMWLL